MSAPEGPAPSDEKAELRRELSAARRARTGSELESARTAVRAAVLSRCAERGWTCVAAYVPLRTEPGSLELLEQLVSAGVRVLVPLLLPERDLDWRDWPDGEPLGVDAVHAADAVLVPALAVAADGTRLGRGGGSYDRALARVDRQTAVAALLHDGELLTCLPREGWDRPVSAVVTPAGWRELGGGRATLAERA